MYIGALAAIASCDHDSSCCFFMASPSRRRETVLAPESARNSHACFAALASAATGFFPSSASTSLVRITRCGTPSIAFVTTVPVTGVSR